MTEEYLVTRPGARATLNESLRRLSEELGGIESIAFDLDGTLYDTRDFERPALDAVAQWLRMKSGKPLRNLATELCNRRERDRTGPAFSMSCWSSINCRWIGERNVCGVFTAIRLANWRTQPA